MVNLFENQTWKNGTINFTEKVSGGECRQHWYSTVCLVYPVWTQAFQQQREIPILLVWDKIQSHVRKGPKKPDFASQDIDKSSDLLLFDIWRYKDRLTEGDLKPGSFAKVWSIAFQKIISLSSFLSV